jgi:hypothetical protein
MPTMRRKKLARRIDIPAEAIEAWQRGDYPELHRALGLKPWELSPFWVDDEPTLRGSTADLSWEKANELRRLMIELAGEPPARLKDG